MVKYRLRCPTGRLSYALVVAIACVVTCVRTDRHDYDNDGGTLIPDLAPKAQAVNGISTEHGADAAAAHSVQNPVAPVVGTGADTVAIVAQSSSSPADKQVPAPPMREAETTPTESFLIHDVIMMRWAIVGYFSAILFVTVLWFTMSYRDESQRRVESSNRSARYKSKLSLPTNEPQQDTLKDQFTQTGYQRTLLGDTVWIGWVGLFLLAQVELGILCCIFFFYVDKPEMTGVIELFMWVFYTSCLLPIIGCAFVRQHWFMANCSLAEATHVLIKEEDFEPKTFRGPSTVKMTLAKVESSPDDPSERWFSYTCIVFFWDTTLHKFRAAGAATLWAHRLPTEGLDKTTVADLLKKCRNIIDVGVPSIFQSLLTEFCNPMWLYQLYASWLAFFFMDLLAGITWSILSVIAGTAQALYVHHQQSKVQEMVSLTCDVEVYRDGKWVVVQSGDLVPKDLIRPLPGQVPCDCLLISGQAVVNESMLTGEPMPVAKTAFTPSESEAIVDPQALKKNMLYAGTDLIQTDGATCIATATGGMTRKGQLVRMVLFPSPIYFKFVSDMPWAILIVILYDVCCVIVMWIGGPPLGDMKALMMTFIIIQSFSPMTFISFVAGQSAAAKRIEAKGMRCLAPARCQVAGKLHLVVFDKTGTLTESGMSIVGVQPGDSEDFAEIRRLTGHGSQHRSLLDAGPLWSVALATCHNLARVQQQWVGPDIEVQMIEASGWNFLPGEQRTFSPPSSAGADGNEIGDRAEVLRVLDFDHHRTTSGALVRINGSGSSEGRTVLFVKGSYEKIATLCPVCSTYDEVTTNLAAQGYYVISLAYRDVTPAEVAHLTTAPRGKMESGLTFLGLLLFRNELKADTKDALSELHGGAIRSIMCTGDNVFTGANIARQCGILEQDDLLIFGDVQRGALEWYIRESDGIVQTVAFEDVVYKEAKFAVTGAAYRELSNKGRLEKLLPRICVFGRMNPEQKRDLVIRYQEYNLIVGMCGDGGNDCAALRAAHVGVALSESEASIVAPFSSGPKKSVHCMVHVAKVGRACLATSIASYRYCIVCGLFLSFMKVSLLCGFRAILSEWQYIIQQNLIAIPLTFGITWCCVENEKLAPHRQQSSLFAAETVLSIAVPHTIFASGLWFMWWLLSQQTDWYEVTDWDFSNHWLSTPMSLFHPSDQFVVECGWFLGIFHISVIGFVYAFGGAYRGPVYKRGIAWYVLVVVTLGLALLFTGPTSLGCLIRVNCNNEMSLSSYVPVLTEISYPPVLGDCFYGPQASQWKPYWMSAADPLTTKDGRKCYPPSDQNLTPAQAAIEPNNILPMYFRYYMVAIASAICFLSFGFMYFLSEPLSKLLRGPRPNAFTPLSG